MPAIERLGVYLGVRGSNARVLFLTVAIMALAKGSAFLPGYSIDDYGIMLQNAPSTTMLSHGRFGQLALLRFFWWLGLEPQHARVFFVALAIFIWALLATLVGRHWHLGTAGWLPVAAASIIAIHPFTTEIFTFRAALGTITCAFALFALLLVPRRWSLAGIIAGAAVFGLALSVYQGVLQYCVMIALMGMAVGLTRILVVGSAAGWPQRITSLLSWRRIPRNSNAALLACAAVGTAGYLLVNAIVIRVLRVGMVERYGVLSPDRLGERAKEVWRVLLYRFLGPSPLVAQLAKRCLLLLLLAALVGLLVRTRPWLLRRRHPALLLLATVALLALAMLWTIGIVMVPPIFWPAPRVMSQAGILWAGVLAIAYRCLGSRAGWMLGLVSLLIVLSFIGSSNHILNDQLRINARDAAKAARIIARLEALPDFSAVEAVAVERTSPYYKLGFRTLDMDMNLSAFHAHWSKLQILREISGYDLQPADPTQEDAAAAYCRTVETWPGPKSVTIQGHLAIVCLGSG